MSADGIARASGTQPIKGSLLAKSPVWCLTEFDLLAPLLGNCARQSRVFTSHPELVMLGNKAVNIYGSTGAARIFVGQQISGYRNNIGFQNKRQILQDIHTLVTNSRPHTRSGIRPCSVRARLATQLRAVALSRFFLPACFLRPSSCVPPAISTSPHPLDPITTSAAA